MRFAKLLSILIGGICATALSGCCEWLGVGCEDYYATLSGTVAFPDGTAASEVRVSSNFGGETRTRSDGKFDLVVSFPARVREQLALMVIAETTRGEHFRGSVPGILAHPNVIIDVGEVGLQPQDGIEYSPAVYTLPSEAISGLVGDVDNDGRDDLVVASAGSETIDVHRSTGAGEFELVSSVVTGPDTILVGMGEFNNDSYQDICALRRQREELVLFLNEGGGIVSDGTVVALATIPGAALLGDFDGDGQIDVAILREVLDGGSVSANLDTLAGDGKGGFRVLSSTSLSYWPESIAAADFNGDGRGDIAAYASDGDTGRMYVLQSKEGVGFEEASVTEGLVVAYESSIVSLDTNGDGNLDVAIGGVEAYPNLYRHFLCILTGSGDGTLSPNTNKGLGFSDHVGQLMCTDVNGDGQKDIVTAAYPFFYPYACESNRIVVLFGSADSAFREPAITDVGSLTQVAVGEFGADGRGSIAAVLSPDNRVSVIDVESDGSLSSDDESGFYRECDNPKSIVVADLNGDGLNDVATGNRGSKTVSLFAGDGTGRIRKVEEIDVGGEPWDLAKGDIDADGFVDLVVAESASETGTGSLSVLFGSEDTSFREIHEYVESGRQYRSVRVADFNRDGRVDLAARYVELGQTGLSILLGRASGGFDAEHGLAVQSDGFGFVELFGGAFAVVDANGDGALDIAVPDLDFAKADRKGAAFGIYLLSGDGTGRFVQELLMVSRESLPLLASAAFSADLNGDLTPELLFGGIRTNELFYNGFVDGQGVLSVLMGEGSQGFRGNSDTVLTPNFGASITAVDFTADGLPDALVVARSLSSDGYIISERAGEASVLPGLGDGTFGTAIDVPVGSVWSATAADMNRDGAADIVLSTVDGVRVLLSAFTDTKRAAEPW